MQLVMSDANRGSKNASGLCLSVVSWQCCKVHFLRDLVTALPTQEVLALVKTMFVQPNQEAAKAAVAQVLEHLEPTVPKGRRWCDRPGVRSRPTSPFPWSPTAPQSPLG